MKRFFYEAVPGITLKFSNSNLAELDAPEHIGRIRLTGSLSQILGVDKKGWIRGKYDPQVVLYLSRPTLNNL